MKKLVLIDGHALVHRAFHALPPTFSSPKGVPTNAVFGFTSVLLKMIKDLKPEYIAATFDLAAPTFRHEEFAEYKAHREKAPGELHAQVPLIKEILLAFGVPIYEKPGFEADDLIGALAERSKKNPPAGGLQTIIMTGDLDTLQLVDDNKVVVFTLKKGVTDTVVYDEGEVFKRYGLRPGQLNDFKGLKGDPSDNIPGVPGIGEKTASALIQTFGTLENLYERISNFQFPISKQTKDSKSKKNKTPIEPPLSAKLIQKLLENKDMAFFSKKLATIIRDVDVDFDLNKADWVKNINRPEIERIFKELGLYSLIKRLDDSMTISSAVGDRVVLRPTSSSQRPILPVVKTGGQLPLRLAKGKGSQNPELTTSEVHGTSDVKGISEILAGVKSDGKMIFDMDGEFINILLTDIRQTSDAEKCKNISWPAVVGSEVLLKNFREIFKDEKILKISHDFKKTAKFLLNYGIELGGPGFDTKLAAYLLNSDLKDYSLDRVYFNEFQEDINKSAVYSDTPIFILKLKERQSERLKKEKSDWLFNNIEVPTSRVLAEMELRGVLIDSKAIAKLSKLVTLKIGGLEKKIHKQAGIQFNINSPKQMKEVLFDPPPGGLNIKGRVRKTSKGALSTAAGELEKLVEEHPIIDLILRYREVQKLKTTYIDPFPTFISKTTGRLHTTFNQTGTTTGRLASQDPNLQNIPIKTELGQEFRKAFIASPGFKLVSFDYSQIELRIAAHISKDEKMTAAFKRGEDIHTRTAVEIFGVKPEAVDPVRGREGSSHTSSLRDKQRASASNGVDRNMRRDAKVLNFGVLYGMGVLGFQRASGVSRERAREFIDKYMKEFSGIAKYMNDMKIKARKDGYVSTIFGRRRWFPEIKSSMPQVVGQAERMAINMPIQGTAADLMKLAMIKVFEYTHDSDNQDEVFLLLQVHDELLFEVKESLVKNMADKIKDIMENVHKFDVPLIVDVKHGDNWAQLKPLANSQ